MSSTPSQPKFILSSPHGSFLRLVFFFTGSLSLPGLFPGFSTLTGDPFLAFSGDLNRFAPIVEVLFEDHHQFTNILSSPPRSRQRYFPASHAAPQTTLNRSLGSVKKGVEVEDSVLVEGRLQIWDRSDVTKLFLLFILGFGYRTGCVSSEEGYQLVVYGGSSEQRTPFLFLNRLDRQVSEMAALKKCNNDGEADNVLLVDLDSDSISDVKIEMPENHAKQPRRSTRLKSDKNVHMRSYIYIDDDDEFPDNAHSSKKNLSRKRMYPGRGPSNSNGCGMQSDCESCDGDGELMVDSSGMLQKLWERASLKKKTKVEIVNGASVIAAGTVDNIHVTEHTDDKSKATSSTSNKMVLCDSTIADAHFESSIVNDREKHKETEEYKRVLEEELLARERALKVQAEEVRLLKRQKAEKTRLLDTERRQKQRIAEIRESQKQDEENMNLKEIYRVEVQQDLKRLEMTCHDMASLLHGLGILADDGNYVPSHQVRAAYKRALLMFHPDRAQRSDMRQQVEAEEKFKLISRMKDQVMMLA